MFFFQKKSFGNAAVECCSSGSQGSASNLASLLGSLPYRSSHARSQESQDAAEVYPKELEVVAADVVHQMRAVFEEDGVDAVRSAWGAGADASSFQDALIFRQAHSRAWAAVRSRFGLADSVAGQKVRCIGSVGVTKLSLPRPSFHISNTPCLCYFVEG